MLEKLLALRIKCAKDERQALLYRYAEVNEVIAELEAVIGETKPGDGHE